MVMALLLHAPKELEDWQLREIASDLRDAVNRCTDFEAGKVSMRRTADVLLTVDLTKKETT